MQNETLRLGTAWMSGHFKGCIYVFLSFCRWAWGYTEENLHKMDQCSACQGMCIYTSSQLYMCMIHVHCCFSQLWVQSCVCSSYLSWHFSASYKLKRDYPGSKWPSKNWWSHGKYLINLSATLLPTQLTNVLLGLSLIVLKGFEQLGYGLTKIFISPIQIVFKSQI